MGPLESNLMRRAIIGKNGSNRAMPIIDREMSSDRLNISFLGYASELGAGITVTMRDGEAIRGHSYCGKP